MQIHYNAFSRTVVVSRFTKPDLNFDCSGGYHSPAYNPADNRQGGTEDVFQCVNDFFSQCSQATAEATYNFYSNIHYVFYNSVSSMLPERLQAAVKGFLHIPGFTNEVLVEWMSNYLVIPDCIMETYRRDAEGIYSREKTYLRHEYIELGALLLCSKMFMPIMGEYMRRLGMHYRSADSSITAIGNTDVKTHLEMLILDEFDEVVSKLPGWTRLIEFTAATISTSKINSDELVIDKQLSNADILSHALAITFVKKLPSSPLFGVSFSHLASRLATTVRGVLASSGRVKINAVNDGIVKESGDDVRGVFDDTYAQYPISVAGMITSQYCTSDEYLIPIISRYLDVSEYLQLSQAMANCKNIYLTQYHISMVATLLGNIISPIVLTHSPVTDIARLLCVAHLVMRAKYPTLATLMLSFPVIYDTTGPTPEPVLFKLTVAQSTSLSSVYPIRSRKGPSLIHNHLTEEVFPALSYIYMNTLTGEVFTPSADLTVELVPFMVEAPTLLDPNLPELV